MITSGKHARAMDTPFNPAFIWQNWGMQGYTYFILIFDPKNRLWVLVRTVLTCTHNKNFKTIIFFHMKFSNFITEKKKSLYIAWAGFHNGMPQLGFVKCKNDYVASVDACESMCFQLKSGEHVRVVYTLLYISHLYAHCS